MKVVLDTHALLYWRAGDPRLPQRGLRAIGRAEEVAIADVTLWEVAMLADLGRVRLDRPAVRWLRELIDEGSVRVSGISPAVAARAVDVRRALGGGDPADHLIAATAIVSDAALVTADARLTALPGLRTVWA